MQTEDWQRRWQEGRTGFHQSEVNKRLCEYWPALGLDSGAEILVPLCGKSLDMLWLHEQGHRLLGVELSDLAVEGFLAEHALEHERHDDDVWRVYDGQGAAAGIRLLCGDFFDLQPARCANVGAFYDRAALIALDATLRARYATHLAAVLGAGVQGLLLSIDYDPVRMSGPPFPVSDAEVRRLFHDDFDIEELACYSGPRHVGNLKERGLDTLDERVYRLRRRPLDTGTTLF